MASASTLADMSPGLLKVVERARREPEGRFHALAQLIDMPALERAYRRQRADAAVGMDGVTKEQYGQALEVNLQDLQARLKAQRYRHQPIRRVHIPKAQGKTRPIGISAFEDKVVQDAVREVLEAIYEQDFFGCSYGFRPGRSAHDAVRTLEQMVHQGEVRWIFEADIVSFFDSLDRTELKKMLEVRVADGSLLRLIGTCLHVGVLDGEAVLEPELGTVQGSVLTPPCGTHCCTPSLDSVRPAVQFSGVSWIRLVSSESLPGVLPDKRYARRCLPSSGSLGSRFPTFPGTMRRSDYSLPVSGRFTRRSLPDTAPASLCSWCLPRAHGLVEAP